MSVDYEGPIKKPKTYNLTCSYPSVGRFSDDLFKLVANDVEGENLVMSPVSVGVLLAMAVHGARGITAKIMRVILHLSDGNLDDENDFQRLINSLNVNVVPTMTDEDADKKLDEEREKLYNLYRSDNSDGSDNSNDESSQTLEDALEQLKYCTIRVATKIFLAKDIEIDPKYLEITKNIYRSPCESLDFENSDDAVQRINDFCANYTNGCIKEFVTKDDIDPQTKMFLANTLYFKGRWEHPFCPSDTEDQPFYVDGKTVVNVPTMYKRADYNRGYVEELDARFIEIPYEGGRLSMIIILPIEINGLEEMIPKLVGMNLSRILSEGRDEPDIELYLPKFKIESTISLEEPLRMMGMEKAFTPEADFSGICKKPIQMTKVVQKAFIEVNEQGTVATAGSGMHIIWLCSFPYPKMKVDRPFAYYIFHKSLNIVLFSGYVRSPLI